MHKIPFISSSASYSSLWRLIQKSGLLCLSTSTGFIFILRSKELWYLTTRSGKASVYLLVLILVNYLSITFIVLVKSSTTPALLTLKVVTNLMLFSFNKFWTILLKNYVPLSVCITKGFVLLCSVFLIYPILLWLLLCVLIEVELTMQILRVHPWVTWWIYNPRSFC